MAPVVGIREQTLRLIMPAAYAGSGAVAGTTHLFKNVMKDFCIVDVRKKNKKLTTLQSLEERVLKSDEQLTSLLPLTAAMKRAREGAAAAM